jgi:tripartite-type tricarboxylate transporter receptor subunit TctC
VGKNTLRSFAATLLAVGVASTAALAQDYPSRPVTVITPFAAGSGNDIVARNIAQHLSERLGQPFVVENQGGAGGITGMTAMTRATPDGYTIGMGSNSTVTIGPQLMLSPPYEPVTDVTGVALVAAGPWLLVVNPSLPVRSVAELVAYAKEHPGELNYCSAGIGTTHQLAFEVFKDLAGIDIQHVPYQGAAPCNTAVIAGEIQMTFGPVLASKGAVEAGQFIPLAVTSANRLDVLPDVPTLSESGFEGYDFANWYGIVAPAGIPADILEKLGTEIVDIVKNDIGAQLSAEGAYVYAYGPAEFADFIKKDAERWAAIIADLEIPKQ